MNYSILPALTLLFLSLLTPTLCVSLGDPCATSTGCDDAATFLQCDPTTLKCVCQEPPFTYFDPVDSRCHKYTNEVCDYPIGPPCPLNGFCDVFTYKCTCIQDYSETTNRKCAKFYDEPCTIAIDCDRDQYFYCIENKCLCDPMTSNYDPVQGQCVLGLHQPCSVTPPAQPCQEYSDCVGVTPTCQCEAGTIDNGRGQCRAEYGAVCDLGHAPCDEVQYLVCGPEKKCECRAGTVYDFAAAQCESLIGQPCGNFGDPSCHSGNYLVCAEDECQCAAGMEENVDGKCRVGEGGQCLSDDECDESKGLKCVDGICQAQGGGEVLGAGQFCNPLKDLCDHTRYLWCDPMTITCTCSNATEIVRDATGNCRRRANVPCSTEEGAQACTENAQCVKMGDVSRCLCNDGLSHNDAGRCVLDFGAHCTPGLPDLCDAENMQFCDEIENRCNCLDLANMDFDYVSEKCYLQGNSPCLPGSVMECGEGLSCAEDSHTCLSV